MHDVDSELNQIDRQVAESPELLGRECSTCLRILAFKFFEKDTSYKEGYKLQCKFCRSQPRLSLSEHTARLHENNLNSYGTKSQRWEHQEDYKNEHARRGRPLHHSEFIKRLKKIFPALYVTEGRIIGNLALYKTYGCKQADGRDFEYIGYLEEGMLPEFSIYEFDTDKDILIKEKRRGWRTPLLRLIKGGHITEKACREEFGEAYGEASTVWHRQLFDYRNNKGILS